MTVISISWYLCALFTVALVAESAITVAPGGESVVRMFMGAWAALAIIFAVVAVTFRWLHVPGPKWLVRVFLGVAVVATVVVGLLVVG
jgi:hypothetical protein